MRRTLHFALLIASLLTTNACRTRRDTAAGADADVTTRDAAATPPAAGVSRLPGCRALVQNGTRLSGVLGFTTPSRGVHSVAVIDDKALVVSTRTASDASDASARTDARGSTARVQMSAVTGVPAGPAIERSDGAVAAATSSGNALAVLSLHWDPSLASSAVILEAAEGPARTLAHGDFRGGAFAGAARGELGIALTSGVGPEAIVLPSVYAIVFTSSAAKTVRIERLEPRAIIDSGAAAVGSNGLAAVAYRVVRGGVEELHVATLAADGKMVGRVEVVDRGHVEAPSIAFEGDTLHIVWESRAAETGRSVLRWIKRRTAAAPGPYQTLGTGVLDAHSPALAIEGDRFALAWSEGRDGRVVKAGSSTRGLSGALEGAVVVSDPQTLASRPKIAVHREATVVVWEETSGKTTELRASPLVCVSAR